MASDWLIIRMSAVTETCGKYLPGALARSLCFSPPLPSKHGVPDKLGLVLLGPIYTPKKNKCTSRFAMLKASPMQFPAMLGTAAPDKTLQ